MTLRPPRRAAGRVALLLAAFAAIALCGCAGPRPAAPPSPSPPPAPSSQRLPPSPPGVRPPTPGPSRAAADSARADSLWGRWWPAIGPAHVDTAGSARGIDWTPLSRVAHALAVLRRTIHVPADSEAVWRALAASRSELRPFALKRLAIGAMTRGAAGEADAWLDSLSAAAGPWSWEALRMRVDLAQARGALARADSLLTRGAKAAWTDLDRAALLVRRARVRQQLGDAGTAIDLAREAVRNYPAMMPASTAFTLLTQLERARGSEPTWTDFAAAAEGERFRGDREAALDRWREARARAPEDERAAIDLRRAQVLHEAGRFSEALTRASESGAESRSGAGAARARLERARILRDSGRTAAALEAYAGVGTDANAGAVAAEAAWEMGLQLEAQRRNDAARAAFAEAAGREGEHRDEARLRLGLLWLLDGSPDRAREAWTGASGEPFDFWRAVLDRPLHRAQSDSVLAAIAASPGYGFYAVAARETLGVVGWQGTPPALDTLPPRREPLLELAESLVAIGAGAEAQLALQRWASTMPPHPPGDSAATAAGESEAANAWLRGARLSYAMGRIAAGIHLTALGLAASPHVSPELGWGLVPWMYPPAFDSLYASLPVTRTEPVDRDLLHAVAWQESKFDPLARSRSNALGLYQLKLPAAFDMARRLGDPRPGEGTLEDPAMSLRYGREYLRWLHERFAGRSVVAIAAYNAGPNAIPPGWETQIARGGEALFCDLIVRPETRDYVRRILGARSAYRELKPHGARRAAAAVDRRRAASD